MLFASILAALALPLAAVAQAGLDISSISVRPRARARSSLSLPLFPLPPPTFSLEQDQADLLPFSLSPSSSMVSYYSPASSRFVLPPSRRLPPFLKPPPVNTQLTRFPSLLFVSLQCSTIGAAAGGVSPQLLMPFELCRREKSSRSRDESSGTRVETDAIERPTIFASIANQPSVLFPLCFLFSLLLPVLFLQRLRLHLYLVSAMFSSRFTQIERS